MRTSGVLLPVFSLPSPHGIGCFSKEAYKFIDRLKEACRWDRQAMGTPRISPFLRMRATRILLIWRSWWKPGF